MSTEQNHGSLVRTWTWLGIMVSIILFKGFLAFFVVSDMGQPTWSYRPIKDVPGQSPYAVYQLLPTPQHVRGAGGD